MLSDMITTSGGSWGNWISGSVRFANDKNTVAIQASDLLAWLIRREGGCPPPHGYEGLMDKLVIYGVDRFTNIDLATLERISAGVSEIPRASSIDEADWREMIPIWEGGHAKALNEAAIAAGLYLPKNRRRARFRGHNSE